MWFVQKALEIVFKILWVIHFALMKIYTLECYW